MLKFQVKGDFNVLVVFLFRLETLPFILLQALDYINVFKYVWVNALVFGPSSFNWFQVLVKDIALYFEHDTLFSVPLSTQVYKWHQ